MLNNSERKQLRKFFVAYFTLEELKDLAFDLGVDHQIFSHGTKRTFSCELIAHCERRDLLHLLVTEALIERSSGLLVHLLAELPPSNKSLKKVQIIVTEDLLDDLPRILDGLATMFNCNPDEVALISATWGSMRLLVSLPENIAFSSSTAQVHRFAEGKYQIISITDFDSLDEISQNTWRFVVQNQPPIQQGNLLRSVVSWKDVLKITTATLSPSPELSFVNPQVTTVPHSSVSIPSNTDFGRNYMPQTPKDVTEKIYDALRIALSNWNKQNAEAETLLPELLSVQLEREKLNAGNNPAMLRAATNQVLTDAIADLEKQEPMMAQVLRLRFIEKTGLIRWELSYILVQFKLAESNRMPLINW